MSRNKKSTSVCKWNLESLVGKAVILHTTIGSFGGIVKSIDDDNGALVLTQISRTFYLRCYAIVGYSIDCSEA